MNLKGKVIVFLSNSQFDSCIKSTSLFIAHNLAVHNKVFYIDYPLTFKDYFGNRNTPELKRRRPKFSLFSNGVIDTDLPDMKIVITPPVLPINFFPEGFLYRAFLTLNEYIIARRVKKVLRAQGVKDFVYINSFNFHYPHVAKKIKPELTIYHCVDPMIVPYDTKHGFKSENQLVVESDLVICTSKALFNEKKLLNDNIYFVPNATDLEHGKKALNPDLPIYSKLIGLPKPVVGYVGAIERRMDYALLEAVALAKPNISIVLAGPVFPGHIPETLTKIPNVYFIGRVSYDDLPQTIKGFDVAIIPFKKDDVSNTIFPLKLFEYLSAGKPVIVTNFNEDLKDFTGDVIDYCADAPAFVKAIESAIATDSPEKIEERLSLAAQNTWQKRAEDIGEIILKNLKPHAK